MLETLCGETLRRLRAPELAAAFKPQELTNILMALQGLPQIGRQQSELLAAAVAAVDLQRDFAGYNSQDLSDSAWALAKMGYGQGTTPLSSKQSQWYAAAVAAAQRPGVMASAKPQAWANLLYALALVRYQPSPTLLEAGAASVMESGTAHSCAITLWALAVLQLRHAGVESAVCDRLGELLWLHPASVPVQHLSSSLWALAVLAGGGGPAGLAAAPLARALAEEAVRRRKDLTKGGLAQLWQARQELGNEVEALTRGPDVQAAMEAAVAATQATGSNPSRTQEQAAKALLSLTQKGLLPIVSVWTETAVEGMLGRVDIVTDWSFGRMVAVEVDGPIHFLRGRKGNVSAVDGSTALRNRQLQRAFGKGNVLYVPYWHWNGLKTPAKQEAYLLRRLQQ